MTNESQFREAIVQSAHDAEFLLRHLQDANRIVAADPAHNILNDIAHIKLLELIEQSAKIRFILAQISGIATI